MNITLKSSLIALGFATLIGTAHADPIAQLQQFNTELKSASGSFSQKLITKSGAVKKSSSGSFVFARPGKFRWTYSAPYEQVLVSNGATLTMYDKDLNQVSTRSLGAAIGTSPAAILFGGKNLDKNFTLSEAGAKDGREWVSAVPKAKNGNFIKVNIGMSGGLPDAMELYDTLGQVTVITFSGVRRNAGVSAASFTFTPPAGASISK
ncbi:MAG: outer membrane lipoprotein chaperone LolA [Formosimonas sp.]